MNMSETRINYAVAEILHGDCDISIEDGEVIVVIEDTDIEEIKGGFVCDACNDFYMSMHLLDSIDASASYIKGDWHTAAESQEGNLLTESDESFNMAVVKLFLRVFKHELFTH